MSKNGTKRKSPSVERQLALALVALIEVIANGISTGNDALDVAATDARAILKTHGYDGLESIPTRVKRIETEITEAVKNQDGARLAKLGAELDRAKAGKPPLTAEKKTRAPRKPKIPQTPQTDPAQPTEKKTRKKKDDPKPEHEGGVASVCPNCKREGPEAPGAACPDCGYLLVAKEG